MLNSPSLISILCLEMKKIRSTLLYKLIFAFLSSRVLSRHCDNACVPESYHFCFVCYTQLGDNYAIVFHCDPKVEGSRGSISLSVYLSIFGTLSYTYIYIYIHERDIIKALEDKIYRHISYLKTPISSPLVTLLCGRHRALRALSLISL